MQKSSQIRESCTRYSGLRTGRFSTGSKLNSPPVPALYIADGHHRAKAALNVVDRRIAAGKPADGEISRFMGVLFAHDLVKIHGYSRLLTDIGTYTFDSFIHRLEDCFDVRKYGPVDGNGFNIPPRVLHPEKFHVFHMYLAGDWYECTRPR